MKERQESRRTPSARLPRKSVAILFAGMRL
ncbi:hypothetical protein AvCA_15560 [Azotobacter vinelandii CA]|uniref:Uncharacterized protein n=2 Tax=Azotobacter vinelandii TaxID=354 RepID=C1DRN3_AZOVD|nr:hypothetical protein Avin_15560 [Azotobacter vinelandii DJ]AGK16980.1 hypothetical protein AvCA_15560 [Azotobacter vinelandii CA]AGK19972.1 hypothetical protein AvCA6_15560 [Azotobacter vinelandii CA6]